MTPRNVNSRTFVDDIVLMAHTLEDLKTNPEIWKEAELKCGMLYDNNQGRGRY